VVIPTVCNLENMIKKLEAVNGDYHQLKPWKREVTNLVLMVEFNLIDTKSFDNTKFS
jgi:hypothetical protein